MTKITISKYRNNAGEFEFQALQNGMAICCRNSDEQFVTMYAGSIFHQATKAILVFYDSEKDKETILDRKGA